MWIWDCVCDCVWIFVYLFICVSGKESSTTKQSKQKRTVNNGIGYCSFACEVNVAIRYSSISSISFQIVIWFTYARYSYFYCCMQADYVRTKIQQWKIASTWKLTKWLRKRKGSANENVNILPESRYFFVCAHFFVCAFSYCAMFAKVKEEI